MVTAFVKSQTPRVFLLKFSASMCTKQKKFGRSCWMSKKWWSHRGDDCRIDTCSIMVHFLCSIYGRSCFIRYYRIFCSLVSVIVQQPFTKFSKKFFLELLKVLDTFYLILL
jgi:hypothetical protein